MKAKAHSPPVCRKGTCDTVAAMNQEMRQVDPKDLFLTVTKFKKIL